MIKKILIGLCILFLPIFVSASEIDFNDMPIGDNIVNLIVSPITFDSTIAKDIKANVKTTIKNLGPSSATNILVKFYVDGELKDTFISNSLNKNEDMNLIFDWVPKKDIQLVKIVVESSEGDSDFEDNIANKRVKVENIMNVNINNLDATLSIPPYFIFKSNTDVEIKSFITNFGPTEIRNIPVELSIDSGIEIKGNSKKTIYSLNAGETKELTWLVVPKIKYDRPGNIMIIKIGDKPMSDKLITYDGVHGFI